MCLKLERSLIDEEGSKFFERVVWADARMRSIRPIPYVAIELDILEAGYGLLLLHQKPGELVINRVKILII